MAAAVAALNFVRISRAACAAYTATLKLVRVIIYAPCFKLQKIE